MSTPKRLFRPSEYFRPKTVAEAVRLLGQYGEKARVLAGGTDLLTERDPSVEALVDISGLELNYIASNGHGVRIGAGTTFADISVSPLLADGPYRALAQAASQMGTPQIRNMATIGGNICAAVPCADSAPPLLALDAVLVVVGPGGQRSLDINEFFQDARRTALGRDEVLTEIRLPGFPDLAVTSFIRKGRVAAADLAIVNVAVRLALSEHSICHEVRIALGAVAPTPVRAKQAEAMLEGKRPHDELLANVADQAAKEIQPIDDIRGSAEYRRTLSRVLVERALKEALARSSA
ncbi:MAG: xanthine dehydrogenase family protein subunit M [Candidatus Hydrogenedentota bacterium]|nr:MAG: xanthine dehydrogenase family protein subunit M [Candidatus Hydrogenedentota bacterium]